MRVETPKSPLGRNDPLARRHFGSGVLQRAYPHLRWRRAQVRPPRPSQRAQAATPPASWAATPPARSGRRAQAGEPPHTVSTPTRSDRRGQAGELSTRSDRRAQARHRQAQVGELRSPPPWRAGSGRAPTGEIRPPQPGGRAPAGESGRRAQAVGAWTFTSSSRRAGQRRAS
jgi:hypothetical protein